MLSTTAQVIYSLVMLGLAAFGVWGFIQWLIEADDRDTDREVAQATLIDSAYKAIADIEAEGESIELTQRLASAMRTLVRYGEHVELRAKTIYLTGADLSCGRYTLTADAIVLEETVLHEASVNLSGLKIVAQMDMTDSTVEVFPPSVLDIDEHFVFVSGVARDSRLVATGSYPYLELVARNLELETSQSKLIINGEPGPLALTEYDVNQTKRYGFERKETIQDIAVTVTALTDEIRDEIGLTVVQDYTNFAPGLSMGPQVFMDFTSGTAASGAATSTPDSSRSSTSRMRLPKTFSTNPVTAIFAEHGRSDVILSESFLARCPRQFDVDLRKFRMVCEHAVIPEIVDPPDC